MLHFSRFYRRALLLAFSAGVILASFAAHIGYPCASPSIDPGSYCVSHEKAILHPADLLSNMQGSLTRFIVNFLVGFAIVLVLIIAVSAARRRRA